jgi:hypothetical protein
VTVTGTPVLTLETGASDAIASYVTGSGTTNLSFQFVVGQGQASSDLDYGSIGALSAGGGTLASGTGTPAVLTLPAPGGAGSLGMNKNLVVDGTGMAIIISGGCGLTGVELLPVLALLAARRRRRRR